MPRRRAQYFNGNQECWTLSGTGGTKSLTLGDDQGFVWTGTQSLAMLCTASSGQQTCVATAHRGVDFAADRVRGFWRFAIDHTVAQFNEILFWIEFGDGTNLTNFYLTLDSNYGGNDVITILIEPSTFESLAAVYPWSLVETTGIWNELEIEFNPTSHEFTFMRLNSTYAYNPTTSALDWSVAASPPYMRNIISLQNTTVQRQLYIDESWIDLIIS